MPLDRTPCPVPAIAKRTAVALVLDGVSAAHLPSLSRAERRAPEGSHRSWLRDRATEGVGPDRDGKRDAGPHARGASGRHRGVASRLPGGRHPRGDGREDRPRRGPARHRLQVRRGHPDQGALDPSRRGAESGRRRRRQGRGPRAPEGGQRGPAHPVEEACPVRTGVGQDRGGHAVGWHDQGPGDRGRQGRPDPGHRPSRVPARLARRPPSGARPASVRRHRARGEDHRARSQPQQRRALASRLPRGVAERGPQEVPRVPAEGRAPQGHGLLDRELRSLRGPRRGGRARPRVRAVVETRRPPERDRAGRPGGRGRGARRRPRARARLAQPQGHPGGPLEGVRAEVLGRRDHGRAGHEARAVRCLRPRRRGDRGPGPHLGDRGPTHRFPRVRPVRRRPGPREGHRGRRAAPQDQPVDASGGRRDAHPRHRDRRGRRRGPRRCHTRR